jgi:hypothetical protein
MAIISIPNSIGGVSIPGALVEGPLGTLFGNKFGRTDLQYPRDLQTSTRGHVVVFNINEIQPATYESVKNFFIKQKDRLFDKTIPSSAEEGWQAAKKAAGEAAEYINKVKNGTIEFGSELDKVKKLLGNESINIKNPTKRPVAAISLYIPDTMAFTYSAQYGQLSLVDAASQLPKVLGGKAVGAVASIINSGPGRLLAKGAGFAFNPQQQLLFDGIDFRTYQMAFTFTPYSKKEAETVGKIIRLLKMHAAPRLAEGSAGMFFVPPSTFNLEFLFNGKENPNVGKVAESVIESIDVNYSPNGFSTFGDGAPVQTTVTINFKEIELITREKIEKGY